MDPNATLDELREITDKCAPSDMDRAAELFRALDEWIVKGGFLPKPWHRDNPLAEKYEALRHMLIRWHAGNWHQDLLRETDALLDATAV